MNLGGRYVSHIWADEGYMLQVQVKSTTTSMQGPMMVEEGEIVDHSGIL